VTAGSRAAAVVGGAVAGLPAAGLAEVLERAALQARTDRKYLVPVERFAELVSRLPDRYAVLEIGRLRGFAYESVYFDTPDLLTYRQHLQGRRRRYKVRTRTYLDSGDCMFEVKLKGRREQTVKARLPYPVADRARITPQAQRSSPPSSKQATASPYPSWPRGCAPPIGGPPWSTSRTARESPVTSTSSAAVAGRSRPACAGTSWWRPSARGRSATPTSRLAALGSARSS
jgi:VTC domain